MVSQMWRKVFLEYSHAYNAKESKKRAIKKLKYRKEILLKLGNSPVAEKVKRRIERLLKE